MTLLQTRVQDKVAGRFKLAARKRAMSPYQFLGELIQRAAAEPAHGWTEHFVRLRVRNRRPLKQNAVISTREVESR